MAIGIKGVEETFRVVEKTFRGVEEKIRGVETVAPYIYLRI